MKIAVTTTGIPVKNNVIFGMGIFHTANGLKVLRQAKINTRQMSRGDSFGRAIFKILCDNGAKTQPRQNTALLIKFMQTAQLTFNGRTITEFFAVLFLFRCREMVRDPPNSPRSVICWDLFLYFLGTLWCYKWATQ